MAKKEEKNPVGRPKLADSESIKKSWFMIGASLVIVFVLVVCGTGVLTSRTPLEVLTFKKAKASVVRTDDITIKRIKTVDNDEIKVKRVRVISMEEVTFIFNRRKYTLTIEKYVIKIRDKSIVYMFDKDSNTINLIEDFLSM